MNTILVFEYSTTALLTQITSTATTLQNTTTEHQRHFLTTCAPLAITVFINSFIIIHQGALTVTLWNIRVVNSSAAHLLIAIFELGLPFDPKMI